ncbi:hypothetical protein HYDPIDRAFT_171596, partial [Hydnomerulius pinastri MD-312]
SFEHEQEGDLIKIAKHISAKVEFWITGNNDAVGIAALGVTACITVEPPEYKVKEIVIPASGLPGATGTVAAHFSPTLRKSDVEVEVRALGTESGASSKSALAFIGRIKRKGSTTRTEIRSVASSCPRVIAATLTLVPQVVGAACQASVGIVVVPYQTVVSLPERVSPEYATALPTVFLASWLGLIIRGEMDPSSVLLIHDVTSSGCPYPLLLMITNSPPSQLLATVPSSFKLSVSITRYYVPSPTTWKPKNYRLPWG